MRRLRLGGITAFTLVALAGPAVAGEITRVASSGEPRDPFDLHVSIRWDRWQERATISREDAEELRYQRTLNAIVPRIAVGLYQDLELHAELPYVLADDRTWRYGIVGDASVGPAGTNTTTIGNNTTTVENQSCGVTCPLFPVAPSTTVYHGGKAGDLEVGLAWGIFNDEKDDTKPFWLVGIDITFPTASLYDPAADRGVTSWASPFSVPANPGPFGEKVWKYDLYTVLSRRIGPIDPYFKAHVTGMSKSNSTYSNCDQATELEARGQMTTQGALNCADKGWEEDAGAKLPWIVGLTFGTEVVPYENRLEQQKVSMDLRLFADYTSSQRFYNELTEATGKIHQTEGYLTMGGLFGLYLRASRYVSLQATASLATRASHYLTGESLGRTSGEIPAGNISGDPTAPGGANPNLNPNFDWRYDAPGRRFRISEVSEFALSFAGVLQF